MIIGNWYVINKNERPFKICGFSYDDHYICEYYHTKHLHLYSREYLNNLYEIEDIGTNVESYINYIEALEIMESIK